MAEWKEEGEALPQVGEKLAVVDSDNRIVAAIELVAVEVIRLGDANLQLALDEGEGFRSVADWREAHERFWDREVLPHLRDATASRLTDDTEVVVERFRLIDRHPGLSGHAATSKTG